MNTLPVSLYQLARIVVALKPQLIHAVGVEGLKFIDDNFTAQAFRGATTDRWPKRKKEPKGARRALLVKTGKLRRSFRAEESGAQVSLSTDVEYAQVHNEGGQIVHKPRTTILNYTKKKTGKLRLSSVRTESQQRKITDIRRGTIGMHITNMPKRQFIGNSPVLNNEVETAIANIILSNIPKQ